mgnify:CR=1 FL=1
MTNNKVSIITPSYNSSRFIEVTIQSVIKQTYTDWEMVIVDDCSKDNSVDIIQAYVLKDDRIKLLINSKNKGAAESRNEALRLASGKYIAFLDSDDTWYSHKLEKQIQFMKGGDHEFTFSAYDIMSEEGNRLGKSVNVPKEIVYNQYLKNTIIGCLTVIINKEKVGYFEMPNIKSSHDMALWLMIMKRGFSAFGLNEVLSTYRLVNTSNSANKIKAAKDVWKVYREIESLSLLKSMYCFLNYAFNAICKRI